MRQHTLNSIVGDLGAGQTLADGYTSRLVACPVCRQRKGSPCNRAGLGDRQVAHPERVTLGELVEHRRRGGT
jgi:hypothetical protein